MSWLFRPAVFIAVSLLLVGLAVALALRRGEVSGPPRPLIVPARSVEVAWLYPATSSASWERLVAGVKAAAQRLAKAHPGIEAVEAAPGPSSQYAVPEIAFRWPGLGGAEQLIFRWYKLTSAWNARAWTEALTTRSPPPIAFISGSTSHWAREAALALRAREGALEESHRPLLLLTSATADSVTIPEPGLAPDGPPSGDESGLVRLHDVYRGRTYRYCFTNRQMATAITRFVWEQPDLRPDADPAFLAQWTDDSYSMDLCSGYQRALTWRASDDLIRSALPLGLTARGMAPLGLPGLLGAGFRHAGSVQLRIDSGIGTFAAPNPFEASAVRGLLQTFTSRPMPRRPLLAVTGQAGPTRRFLRDLARSAPLDARRFTVVTGDAISFDTVYRDRLVTWPIQDLPFHLVFFCHYDPVSAADGFDRLTSPGGTEAKLQYQHIAQSLAEACRARGRLCRDANEMRDGLEELQWGGQPLFSKSPRQQGMRLEGTGECIVRLRPEFDGGRVLPRASIEVWKRGDSEVPRDWELRVMEADYTGAPSREGME
jgi:hypothetical protein